MKKVVRIALVVAAWAAVTWLYRDKLLPLPRPEKGPAPHFRAGAAVPPPASRTQASPAADVTPTPSSPPPAAAEAVPDRQHSDDLTEIVGIGPVYQGRLSGAGITTFADLAAADPAALAEAIDVADSVVTGWIDQARRMGV